MLARETTVRTKRRIGWGNDICFLTFSNSYEAKITVLEETLQKADLWACSLALMQCRHLGTDFQSTMYAAELSGIDKALAWARKDNMDQQMRLEK